ncbi:MAG: hypothetical protein ABIC40_00360, partial [bacterium]
NNKIFFYDPNHPGLITHVVFNTQAGKFEFYDNKYDRIWSGGFYNLQFGEPFENILSDAPNACRFATIDGLFPTNGCLLYDNKVHISGTIQSGYELVNRLEVEVIHYVDGTNIVISEDISLDGKFDFEIPIASGENAIEFSAYGGFLKDEDITIANLHYTYHGMIDDSIMKAVLYWGKDGGDSQGAAGNLYVIDPTGDYSCYFHPETKDGGEWCYWSGWHPVGPAVGGIETWNLDYSDTVRYAADYRVRVHNRRTPTQYPGSLYTVILILCGGTQYQEFKQYSGYISAYDLTVNCDPTDTGPDWNDVFLITLVKHYGAGFTGNEVEEYTDDNGVIHLTVPVPPSDVLYGADVNLKN